MTVSLTEAERARLKKLVGMLGSNMDGEKLAALNMIDKLAQSKGLKIHELLLGELDPPPPTLIFTDIRKKPQPHWSWKDRIAWVLELAEEDAYLLSDWEYDFCQSFIMRGYRVPTPKQLPIMQRIFTSAMNRYG